MRAFILSMILCASSFAVPLPTGNWDTMYKEIHGNGEYSDQQRSLADRKARAYERDNGSIEKHAARTNRVLRGIFKIAVMNLKRYGFDDEARDIQQGWREHDGELQRIVAYGYRDIGDFKPLSDWLASAYDKIESKLGYQLCMTLKLSAIKSYNYGIPVFFQMCRYGETEAIHHGCGDSHLPSTPPNLHPYEGIVDLTAYFSVLIGCEIGTYGAGTFWICSPLAMLTEWVVDNKLCEPLTGFIFDKACGR